jgi:heme/copper-type cytochrome/quinol oxidase subunit 1
MKQKPYHLLLWIALALVLASFFVFKQNNSVDIHFHDTYFIIAHTHVFWLLAIVALFVWVLYWMTNKLLYSKKLTWVHVVVTVVALLLFACSFLLGNNLMNPTPRRYYEPGNWSAFNDYYTFSNAIGVAILALLFGQVIYILNLLVGLVRGMGKQTAS